MGCGSSVANRNPNTTEKQQTANDETTSVRPLTRSSTLTTVSSTRGRKASSSTGMPYLVDYGKLARSVDEELDELQSSFKEKSPPSNALTKPGSFKYGDLELTQQELSRQRIERFARNSPSSDRSGPLLNSRQRSVFALNDFSILEDDLLGAPSYADWSPEVLVVRPEIVLSLPVNMSGYSKRIRTIAMLNSGGFYVATADSDACYAHNAKGEVSRRYPDFKNAKKGLVDRVMSITIPRDGEKFATLHADGAVVLREVSQVEVGESRDVTLIPEDSNGPPSAIAITLESEMVLVGDTAGHIRAFDVLNKRQTSFQKHGTTTKRSAVHFLEMSHYYNRNITRGAETSMLDANDAFLGVAAATTTTTTSTTRNGKERTVEVKVIRPYLVMSGGGDNVVHLWLTSVPEANYCTYFKHDCPVKNGFFLPNGRTAVTSDDKAVHLWAYTVLDVINGKPPVVPANALDTTTPLRKVTLIEMVKSLSLSTTGNEGKIVIPPPQKNGTIHSTSSDFATSAGHHPLAGPNTCWSARKALFGPTGTSQIHVFTTSTVYRPNKGNCGFFIADTHGGLFAFTIYSNDQWTVWSTNRSAPICALATSPGLLIIGDVFGNLQRYNIRNSPQQDCDY